MMRLHLALAVILLFSVVSIKGSLKESFNRKKAVSHIVHDNSPSLGNSVSATPKQKVPIRSRLKPTGKGVGLSFVKSLVNLRGCAVGVKIPVSGQFKSWDQNNLLPKVNSFIGVQYPLDYRVSLTGSYPFDPVLKALFGSPSDPSEAKRTYLKRFGMTLSMLYNKNKGLRFSLGPFGQLFISQHHMRTVILPLMLLFPSLFACFFDRILYLLRSIEFPTEVESKLPGSCPHRLPISQQQEVKQKAVNGFFSGFSNGKQPPNETDSKTDNCQLCKESGEFVKVEQKRSLSDWNRILMAVIASKSADIGANLGYYYPLTWALWPNAFPYGGVMGSAASLDFQAFHPIFLLCRLFTELGVLKED